LPRPTNRSITLRKSEVGFIKKYLKEHANERLREGKALSVVSVIREGLLLWAEKEDVLDEFLRILKPSE